MQNEIARLEASRKAAAEAIDYDVEREEAINEKWCKKRLKLEAFDESLVKRWLERIIVWDDHFTVELKSGLKIEIDG